MKRRSYLENVTPLMVAASDPAKIDQLTELVATSMKGLLFATDSQGRTALDWARLCGNDLGVAVLRKAMMSDIHDARLDSAHAALDYTELITHTNECQSNELLEAIKSLDEEKALGVLKASRLQRTEIEELGLDFFVDKGDDHQNTPLILAAGYGLLEVVNLLLDMDANIDKKNHLGITPFSWACISGHGEVVRSLLFRGADIYQLTTEGRSGLHFTCLYGKANVASVIFHFLFEKFATFRIQHPKLRFDPTRWTNYANLMEQFLNVKDSYGFSAFDLISKSTDLESDKRGRLIGEHLDACTDRYENFNKSHLLYNASRIGTTNMSNSGMLDSKDLPGQYEMTSWNNAMHALTESAVDLKSDVDDMSLLSLGSHISLEWSHDTDKQHADGIHHLSDLDRIPVLPLEKERKELFLLFQNVQDRIYEWRICATKEEEIARPVRCWLECGFIAPLENILPHLRDSCPHRATQCFECHRLYPFNSMKEHLARSCPKRKVACPYAWSRCREIICRDFVDTHILLRCKLRPVFCRLNCGASVPLAARERHETEHCRKRQIVCDLCKECVISEDIGNHLHNVCSHRQIKCSVSCGQFFLAKDLANHEKTVCIQPCRWKCGQCIGPFERRNLHEYHSCLKRPYVCKHGCGMGGLTFEDVKEHELYQCLDMPVRCPKGCGSKIKRRDIDNHLNAWSGVCPERMVRCPSNLVGWKIKTVADEREGLIMKYRRLYDDRLVKFRFSEDGIDQLLVRFSNSQEWLDIKKIKFTLINKIKGENIKKGQLINDKFTCGWIMAAELTNHLACLCPNRTVWISSKVDSHAVNDTYKGQGTSFEKAVEAAIRRKDLDDFAAAVPNTVSCPFCSEKIQPELLEKHKRSTCPMVMVRCARGCGLRMQRHDHAHHVEIECPKRPAVCPLCGDDSLWFEEIESHLSNQCSKRPYPCQLGCGQNDLVFCTEEAHRLNDCPNRMVVCSCGQEMKYHEYRYHKISDCVDLPVLCLQGCGKSIRKELLQHHMQHECENRAYFYQRYVSCPIGCGKTMMLQQVLEHICYVCKRRLSDCPLGCGDTIQFDKMKAHLYFCPKRKICCEPGRKQCEKLFYQWFYKKNDSNDDLESVEDEDFNDAKTSALVKTVKFCDSTASMTSQSSIFIEPSGRVSLKSDLLLIQCEKHGISALMTAVKANEYIMADYIIRQTNGKDLDLESDAGDTALTIACRLGRYELVELLLQNGAYVNKETNSGRTALIEATRAPNENLKLIDLLLKAGAVVNYKTKKHGKSALHWSRLMKYEETARMLDLGAMVQAQTSVLFRSISCGNMDKLREIIGDGDFFNPNNEELAYVEMEKFYKEHRTASKDVIEINQSLHSFTEEVEKCRERLSHLEEKVKQAQEQQKILSSEQEALDNSISKGFVVFERTCNKLLKSDIEEILRMKSPEKAVRISCFAYGILWGILDSSKWVENSYDFPDAKLWWPQILQTLKDSSSALIRVKSYSLNRLMPSSAKHMLLRAKQFFLDLSIELGLAVSDSSMTVKISNPQSSKGVDSSSSSSSSNLLGSSAMEQSLEPYVPKNKIIDTHNIEDDFLIPDENYDSDAEEGIPGTWIKGEWIALLPKNRDYILDHHKKSSQEADIFATGSVKYPPVVYVSQHLNEIQTAMRTEVMQNETKSEVVIFPKNNSATDIFEVNQDMQGTQTTSPSETWGFVHAIYILLKAANTMADNRDAMLAMQGRVADANNSYDIAKAEYLEGLAKFEENQRRRSEVEQELIDKMKYSRFMLKKSQIFKNKVRVARLLNFVSPNGHTALSWASSLGYFDAVDELLSRGSSVGYTANLMHMSATFLQITFKIYRLSCSNKLAVELGATNAGIETTSEITNTPLFSKKESANILEKIFELKDKRKTVLKGIVFARSRLRFPIPEAAYAGKWEVIRRIFERRLFHYHCANSWLFPLPPPPLRTPTEHHHHRHKKIEFMNIVALGMNDLAAGAYVAVKGWVGPNDPEEPFGESQKELSEIWRKVEEKRMGFIGERRKVRALIQERRRQLAGMKEMSDAIYNRDIRKCILLAQECGVSIDHESEKGYTPLLAASEENTGMINHIFMTNEDGRSCLEVEYLLDREMYRPGIDVEVKSGFNPLIRACSLSRYHVVEALLDRGANINYQNRFGKTALHHAAAIGSIECTRILIERGAEMKIKDNDGKTPYDIADEMGFLYIIQMMSQYTTGYFGPLRVTRGRVQDTITCPLGCSKAMYRYEIEEHLLECPLRDVECPNHCNDKKLLYRDLDEHLEKLCVRRKIECQRCFNKYEYCNEIEHKENECTHRIVDCPLGCDQKLKWIDIEKHSKLCTWRIIECPLVCGEMMTVAESYNHVKKICLNRRISCPLKCAALVVAKQLTSHIMDVCPCKAVNCQFCNASVVRRDLHFHERSCSVRCEQCPNKCGESICIVDMDHHLKETCTNRFVDCRLNCGLKIRFSDMDRHVAKECSERVLDCPNGCLVDETVHPSLYVTCSFKHKHLDAHIRFECPLRKLQCCMCAIIFNARDLPIHQDSECLMRMVHCRLIGCLKSLPFKEREDHERHHCRFRLVACSQGCGEQVLFLHGKTYDE